MSKWGVFGVSRKITYIHIPSPLGSCSSLVAEYCGELTTCLNENTIILFFLLVVFSYTNKKFIVIVSTFILARRYFFLNEKICTFQKEHFL